MVSRIEAHIVSHYRSDRAEQLSVVLEAILGWRNCIVEAVVTSNTDAYETTGVLAPFESRFAAAGHRLRLNVVEGLANPRMLTWEHKTFLPAWLEHASPGEDFFLYIEDDIRVTNENLVYFIRTLKQLKPHGLIPGFLRYEMKGDELRLVDITAPEFWERDRTIRIDGKPFHACVNPYWAGFMLDRDLAREYLASPSSSVTGSEFAPWNIQERAAMGLTWENPPAKLKTRLVIPIEDGRPDPACLVWHCSNSYSAEDHPVVARLTIEAAFRREPFAAYLARKLSAARRRALGR
jgi:hypothetical protein